MLIPCVQKSKARTGTFLRQKLISDYGLFFPYESQQVAANGQDPWDIFQGCTGLWTAECWLARQLHRLKASTAMDLGTIFSLISA